ncbi:MAG: hypothetical protein WBV39_07890 [Rudaea sp.]
MLLDRIRRGSADALTLFLLPAFVSLLPWRWGFAILKRVSRSERLYREAVEPAWAAAQPHCPDSDATQWKSRFRLLRLVDHADVYLTLLRGKRWRRRYVVQIGQLPKSATCVLLTYHWGAGNWIWPVLRNHGIAAHFLARRAQGRALGLTRASHWFGRFRGWALRRIGSAGALFTGGSSAAARDALGAGRSIVGMLDLPVHPQQRFARLALFDGEVRFPLGLADLGLEAGVPLVLFSVALDFDTGARTLRLEALPADSSLEAVMRNYAQHLDARLREAPEAWHMWREATAMFVTPVSGSQSQGIQ